MSTIKYIILIGFILLFSNAWSQEKLQQFYEVPPGLSQNTVTAIAQDELGFLWVGTRYGLNRYDGKNFIHFENDERDSLTLSHNNVFTIVADQEGKVWIGTYGGGLNLYDIHQKTMKCYRSEISDLYITSVYEDSNKNIWIGTEKGGVNVYDPKTDTFDDAYVYKENANRKMPQDINAISEDRNGKIWVGTWEEGLFSINPQTGTISNYKNIIDNENVGIRCLHKSTNNQLWAGTNKGIREITTSSEGAVFKNVSVKNEGLLNKLNASVVLSVYQDSTDVLWVGTENNGLFIINLKTGNIHLYEQNAAVENSLNSNSIWSLFGDKEGNVWIGTYLNGLSKSGLVEHSFEKINKTIIGCDNYNFGLVSAFASDGNENIWIGTDGGGLYYYDAQTKEYKHYGKDDGSNLSRDEITALLIDQHENLWVGTWNGGLSFLEKGSDTFQVIKHGEEGENSISGNDIRCFLEDSKGRIWISAYRYGLDVYDPNLNKFVSFNEEIDKRKLESVKIRALAEDRLGNIWIGTEENGLQRITLNENLEIISSKFFFNKDEIYYINYLFEDSKGDIWVGTEGKGLYRYDSKTETFEKFTSSDGLPSDMIYAILEDEQGIYWISTNKGLSAFDYNKKTYLNYDVSDGLQNTEFYKSACLKSKNTLYFGGVNGFNKFNPSKIEKKLDKPDVYITDILISNKAYPFEKKEQSRSVFNDQKIKLKHFQNDLTVNFTAVNFAESTQNLYQYKLENYDDNWRNAGGENTAYYSNIPPGHYAFKIKSFSPEGGWEEEKAKFDLRITKPWYATYLAYLFYALMILCLLLWARNIIISKERIRNELDVEQLELRKMQELDELKTQFFANVSHEFKTPLTLIISPLQVLMQNSKKEEDEKKYGIMLKNAERLYRLINQMLDLSKLESGFEKLNVTEHDLVTFVKNIAINFTSYAEENNIQYTLELPEHELPIYYEKQKLEKVLVNLLSNAFKYTSVRGGVSLILEERAETVAIKIVDTGKGIKEEELDLIFDRYYKATKNYSLASTGIGLSLTKQIVELHKGNIKVESELDKGTTFVVELLKGNNHFDATAITEDNQPFVYSEESLIEMQEFNVNSLEVEEIGESEKEEQPIILVVEDNEDMRTFISDSLAEKYKVLQAENGKIGLELAKEHLPDIVITDAMMPEMDGFELSQELKSNALTCHIFVIMLTVKSSEKSYEQGLKVGVDNYLTKPFNYNLLELRVQNLLQSRKKFKEQVLSVKPLSLEPSKLPSTSPDEKFIKDFIQSIEQNISNPNYKIENFCKDLGYSKSQFYRKTKSLLGQTPNHFVRTIKLKRAAQLLEEGHYKISEITYKVGFNDLKYFRECFKKQYEMTPSEYIEQHQNKKVVNEPEEEKTS